MIRMRFELSVIFFLLILSLFNYAEDFEDCDEIGKDYSGYLCYIDIANKTKDISICDKIPDTTYAKSDCYTAVAIVTKNTSLCEEIGRIQKGTTNACYEKVARTLLNHSVCEKISVPHRKDDCYMDVAQLTKDASICGFLEWDLQRNPCYIGIANKTQDISICDNIPDTQSDIRTCYITVAINSRNISLCEKVEQIYEGSLNYCFESLAKSTLNHSLCDRISNSMGRDFCYEDLARLTQDASLCEYILDPSRHYDCCVELKSCGLLLNSTEKNRCLAGTTGNPYYCTLIEDESSRRLCYHWRDTDLCSELSNQEDRDDCHSINQMCSYVVNQGIKDDCYYGIYKCDKISLTNWYMRVRCSHRCANPFAMLFFLFGDIFFIDPIIWFIPIINVLFVGLLSLLGMGSSKRFQNLRGYKGRIILLISFCLAYDILLIITFILSVLSSCPIDFGQMDVL